MNAHADISVDPWAAWRDALAARKPVDVPKGEIAFGYYRARDGECIAFLPDAEGRPYMWRTSDKPVPTHSDAIAEQFSWVCRNPVSHEDATFYGVNGRWPEQLAPAPAADGETESERIAAELKARRAEAWAWFKPLGKIATQADCDRMANYADAFAKLEKRADEARKAEKEPHLEASRAVDATWKPVIETAGGAKKWAKEATTAFLIAERDRIAAEQCEAARVAEEARRKADKAAQEAAATGAPPPAPVQAPPPAPPPEKAKAGTTGRGVSLKTETVFEVADPRAFLRWLADSNADLPADLLAVLKTHGRALIKAGLAPAGVITRTEERAV